MKNLIISFICASLSITLSAQKFSTEHERFIKEFNQKLDFTGEIRDNSKSIAKEFGNFWASGVMSDKDKDNFIEIANLMVIKNCKAYPDFVCLADNIMQFNNKNKSAGTGNYENYIKALENVLNKGKYADSKAITDLLMAVNYFVRENIIVKNANSSYWKVDNNNFRIKFDKELLIEFYDVDLVGYQKSDSLKIYQTNGVLALETKSWKGKGGTVGWERVGYSLDSVNAKLSNYSIEMKNMYYNADTVMFTHKKLFSEPLKGKFFDKTINTSPADSDYPKFMSESQHFELKDILKGVDYKGGFTMQGKNFVGSGTKERFSQIIIPRNDSVKLIARAETFYIDKHEISSTCAVTIKLGEDSIFHPHLFLKFNDRTQLLELIRTKLDNDMSIINYVNSYHNVVMDFTWLQWKINEEKISFNTISTQQDMNEAWFESLNFYSLDRYKNIQKRDPQHPLVIVTDFVKYNGGKNDFSLDELADYMKYGKTQVLRMVLSLAYQGFLFYNIETEQIKIYPNCWQFLEAHRGTKDYDVIQFFSKIRTTNKTSNAELSLLNFDLKINGVESVKLSDSINVFIFPIDQRITLKKNTSFTFNGTIQASQFYLYGSNFKFDYNRFMIELNHCDSMKMVAAYPDMVDARGLPKPAIVRNKLEQINGEFFIDNPQNKSGRKSYPEYPRFISTEKTYIYFDRPDVCEKAYKRDSFYFEVEPFRLDSIKGYSPDNIKFNGTLYSSIFPAIKEIIVLRKSDFSLGFTTNTGANGLPIYEGKAKYWNTIDLSNFGLRGSGKIEYLTSTMDADQLLFLPEEMQGHANNFAMKQQNAPIEYPVVKSSDNTLNWKVNEDKFNVIKKSKDFEMFGNNTLLDGDLTITSAGLKGNGDIYIDNAMLRSNEFRYKTQEIFADTTDFKLFTQNILNIDFDTRNVQSHVNFKTRDGRFKSNNDVSTWNFARNKYKSEMNEMQWFMDKKELAVVISNDLHERLKSVNVEENPNLWEKTFTQGPKFTSTHYQQDSLTFFSPKVVYDYEKFTLTAEDVKMIRVADVMVFNAKEKIIINLDAEMRPIKDAKILIDTLNKYHLVYNANVNISGKNTYIAKGDYDYTGYNQTVEKIHFDKISPNAHGKTQASGKIEEIRNFTLGPYMNYQGNINLYANSELLEFAGATKLLNQCDSVADWLKFKAFIDPENVQIPVDSISYNLKNTKVYNGLLISNTNKIYPAFITRKQNQYDTEIFTSNGILSFDETSNEFVIASKQKTINHDTIGNILKYNRTNCTTTGEGKLYLSKTFGLFEPNIIGNFKYDPYDDSIVLNVAMLLEAHFSAEAQKIMAERIKSAAGIEGFSLNESSYEKAIYEYFGENDAQLWFKNVSYNILSRKPKGLENKFTFADLKFTWNKRQNAFIHHGQIGIANIGKEDINMSVFGFIKIEKNRRGDTFEMLLELDNNMWYYFRYANNTFTAISSDKNDPFNDVIYNTKASAKELNKNGLFYQYGLASAQNGQRFKTDMHRLFDNK